MHPIMSHRLIIPGWFWIAPTIRIAYSSPPDHAVEVSVFLEIQEFHCIRDNASIRDGNADSQFCETALKMGSVFGLLDQ